MNNWKLSLNSVIAAGVLLASPALAQVPAASPKPMEIPLVNPIPKNTEWKIKVTSINELSGSDEAGPALKEIRGERTSLVRHEVVAWSTGDTERWLVGNLLLETALGRKDIIPTRFPKNTKFLEAQLGQLPELNWLSPSNFRGIVEYKGKNCRYYEFTVSVQQEIDSEMMREIKAGKRELPKEMVYQHKAWIDVPSGLPLAFESQDHKYEYEFSPRKDGESMSMPDKFIRAAREIDPAFAP